MVFKPIFLVITLLILAIPLTLGVDVIYNQHYGMKVYRNDELKGGCFNGTVTLNPSIAFYSTSGGGVQPVSGTHDFRLAIWNAQDCSGTPIYNQSFDNAIYEGFLNLTLTNLTIITPLSSINMTQINNTISSFGLLAGFNSTYNVTYHNLIQWGYNWTTTTNETMFDVYGSLWYNYTSPSNLSMYLAYGSDWYNHTSAGDDRFVNVDGDTMTGGLTFPTDINITMGGGNITFNGSHLRLIGPTATVNVG